MRRTSPRRKRLTFDGRKLLTSAGLAVSFLLHGLILTGVLVDRLLQVDPSPPSPVEASTIEFEFHADLLPENEFDLDQEPESVPDPAEFLPLPRIPPPEIEEVPVAALEPDFSEILPPRVDWSSVAGAIPVTRPAKPESTPGAEPEEATPSDDATGSTPASTVPSATPKQAAPAVFVAARPIPLRCKKPRYPRHAERMGIEGRVVLVVEVDATGAVVKVEIALSSGQAILDRAAVDGVSKWQFSPATRDGIAVSDRLRLTIRFDRDG